jgi:hypothetical protein
VRNEGERRTPPGPYSEAAAQKQSRRLSRHVYLPEGEWQITVRLKRGECVIAQASEMVTVGNPDERFNVPEFPREGR